MSMNRSEQVRMAALNALSRSMGFLCCAVSRRGASEKQRQQVLSMLSGFMAKTGKLMPMKEPVEMKREIRNLMILGCRLFFSSLMNSSPPYYRSRRQSPRLQQSSYSTASTSAFSSFCSTFSSFSFSCCCYFLVWSSAMRWRQSIALGFCISRSGTSLQSWKKRHSLNTSTTCCRRAPLRWYYRSPACSRSPSSVRSQREIAWKGSGLALDPRTTISDMLSPSSDNCAFSQAPRYLDLISQSITIPIMRCSLRVSLACAFLRFGVGLLGVWIILVGCSIEMGSQSSFCGEASGSIAEPLTADSLDDPTSVGAVEAALDPLQKFLRSPNTLHVKTLNQLLAKCPLVVRGEASEGGREEQEAKQVGKEAGESLEEEIANRIRRKTSMCFSGGGDSAIMHLLEQEIDSLAQEKTELGERINASSIDRGTVFRKLKIDLASFIKVIHDSAAAHYTFRQVIGEGSFGKVYRAICKRTKQERAIKVLKHRVSGAGRQGTFLAEFNLLSQLDHPNIVKLYEIYYYRSFYYVVMEYCRGGSLIELIRRLRQFPESLVAAVAQQLLAALAYLHQRGIVHRDIKLDNLVFLEGEAADYHDYHVKIIDFGTAVRRSEAGGRQRLAGTRYYMAPEVFRGVLTEKSDLWSCGVFLHLFFTGRFPFTGQSLAEVERSICTRTVTFVEHDWQEVSMEARKLILALLERSIERRPSAVEALGHAWFRRAAGSEPATYSTCNLELLERYHRGNNLIAIVENYLSLNEISQAERERLATVFRRIDTNQDGSIQASELMSIYREHFGEENEEEVGNILGRIDQNQSGKIDFNEFLLAMYTRKRLFLENALTDAFRHYDANRDGFLQRSELKALLEGCDREEVEYLLKELDADGDECVSLEEFLAYMRRFG